MQCPVCTSEISADETICPNCNAVKVLQRTTVGIFVGSVGVIVALLSSLLWIGLLVIPFTSYGLKGFPWVALIVGTSVAAGLLWYSKSTRHFEWIR